MANISTAHPQAWLPALSTVSPEIRDWLQFRGSLTRRIQERCAQFYVEPVFQELARVYGDEWIKMKLRPHELALVREVYLYCCDKPVVFAHSIVPHKDLRGAWRTLNNLGNRPLASMLFTNPRVKRTPLEFKKISAGHFLYDRAVLRLTDYPSHLWARRSRFTLQCRSILVTEVFLPDILNLT
ncbi:chorismate lyase [Nitrosomonas marina]|uniref:Probable chorismate pyruvate-lyase n=1 Tax=Nitrosomonas marina TaxID=917 RepID=A0A1I0A6W7_9PROT|nr:chorismate lyase [Nitrosomonas marina]